MRAFRSATTFVVVLFVVATTTEAFAQAGWQAQTSNTTQTLNSVWFANEYQGIAVGNAGTVRYTLNGGLDWNTATSALGSADLKGVWVYSDGEGGTTGLAYAVGTGGGIMKSTDMGATWTIDTAGAGTSEVLYGVSGYNSGTNATIVGAAGTVLTTTNSGATWTSQTSGTSKDLYAISVSRYSQQDQVAGGDSVIIYSTNGGPSWSAGSFTTISRYIWGIDYPTQDTVACAMQTQIQQSVDGGSSWSNFGPPGTNLYQDISFIDGEHGIAVASQNPYIIRTNDGGANWTTELTSSNNLNSVSMVNNRIATASGANGTILRYQKFFMTGFSPARGGDAGLSTNLAITFNTSVTLTSGTLSLYDSDNNLIESFPYNSSRISGDGTETITIDPTSNLVAGKSYYVTIDPGFVEDASGDPSLGFYYDQAWTFTAAHVLTMTANAATNVGSTTATLNGSANPNGDTAAVRFLYGTTSGVYTDSVSAVPDTVSGFSTTAVSASVTGLSGGTTYYYVVAGANNATYSRSSEQTFATVSAVWGYDLLYSPSNHTLDSTSSIVSTDTSSVTIDAWVKWDGTTTGFTPLIASNGNGATDGYGLYLYTNDHLSILLGAVAWLVSDSTLPVGEWSHVALVRSGGTIVLYKDGHSLSFSDPNTSGNGQTPPKPPATPFYVGGETGATYPDLFPGEIDEVRLSDTARYSGSSYIVPDGPFTTDAHTIALYHFNEGSGSTAGDSSGNGNDLTLVNSPTWTGSDNPATPAPLPVEMAAFSVTSNALSAQLRWQTATEVDNEGWEVERKAIANFGPASVATAAGKLPNADWVHAGFVKGAGTSTEPKQYAFADQNLSPGTYDYRLKQTDRSGSFKYSQTMQVVVGSAPRVFTLNQNYPNPFNPTTTIEFTLANDGHVSLKVYDMLGREVATLLDENRKAGQYQQVVFDASRYASGIYFAVLRSGGKVLLKKMLLLK